eukprot:432995_1
MFKPFALWIKVRHSSSLKTVKYVQVAYYGRPIETVRYWDFKIDLISKGISSRHVFIRKKTSNSIYCIGLNDEDQCGVSTRIRFHDTTVTTPMAVPLLNNLNIKSIATGGNFSIFLTSAGRMFSCGLSSAGALGLGEKTTKVSTPTMIPTELMMIDIAAGVLHCIAILMDGRSCAWGENDCGQAGQSKETHEIWTPTVIHALQDRSIKSIACGRVHSLLLASDGSLFACGFNYFGSCGTGASTGNVYQPQRIRMNNEMVKTMQCGSYHNVLVTEGNSIYLWGQNEDKQCLVFGKQMQNVSTPTMYNKSEKWKFKEIEIIPGFQETRIILRDCSRLMFCGFIRFQIEPLFRATVIPKSLIEICFKYFVPFTF